MPTFTISADSMEELHEAFVELFGDSAAGSLAAPGAPAADKPKRVRRTKAEIEAARAAAAAAPQVAAAPAPTTAMLPTMPQPTPAPMPTMPQPTPAPAPVMPAVVAPPVPVAVPAMPQPGPGHYVGNGTAPVPSQWAQAFLRRVGEMVQQHSVEPVYAWVRKSLSLPDNADEAAINARIMSTDDAQLAELYKQSGGQ